MTSLLATTPSATNETTTQTDGTPIVETGATQTGGGGNSDGINWEKRYKDLQSYSDRTLSQVKSDLKQAQASTFVVPNSPEEIEAFKAENPAVYNMINTLANQRAKDLVGDVSQRVDAVEVSNTKTAGQLAKAAILARYPDFAQIVNSPEFKAWASTQTPEIQNWIYNNPDNASLAIAALDMFKAQATDRNDSSSPNQDSAADAVSTNSSPDVKGKGKIWTGTEIQKLTPQQYEKHEEAIDTAWEEGRVNMNA